MFQVSWHLWVAFFLVVVGVAGGFFFLNKVGPEEATSWQLGLAYFLIFLTIYGVAQIGGLAFRLTFLANTGRLDQIRSSRRQALLLGFLGLMLLMLQAQGILTWQIQILLFVVFLLIELYAQ